MAKYEARYARKGAYEGKYDGLYAYVQAKRAQVLLTKICKVVPREWGYVFVVPPWVGVEPRREDGPNELVLRKGRGSVAVRVARGGHGGLAEHVHGPRHH